MKKVFVFIPSKDGKVCTDTMHMLLSEMRDAMLAGWDVIIEGSPQTPIEAARNTAVMKFLATDATDLFYIDNDVCCERGAFLRTLEQPVDFVGGCYPHRIDVVGFPIQWNADQTLRMNPVTGLITSKDMGLPAGFLRVKRVVVERLIEAYGESWYSESSSPNGRAYPLFEHVWRDHQKMSEDFEFCRKWRQLGGQVWTDPNITFGHVGPKLHIGNLYEFAKSRGVPGGATVNAPAIADKDGVIQHYYAAIPGWFEAQRLYAAVVKWANEGSYFVEVGAFKGRSAAFMAVEIANSKKLIAFDVVDHFKGSGAEHETDPDVKAGTLRNAFAWFTSPVKDFITGVVAEDSITAAGRYRDGTLDFVFIDAAHDTESVAADIAAWRPKMKADGIIAGDDYNAPSVATAVNAAFGESVIDGGRWWIVPPDSDRGRAFMEALGGRVIEERVADESRPAKPPKSVARRPSRKGNGHIGVRA